jgi:predicted O-methyltransferase YrrM
MSDLNQSGLLFMPKLKYTTLNVDLYEYIEANSFLPHPILTRVASETANLVDANMQIPRHQGGFMHMLAKLSGAREAIEVGCYTGYSAIAVASALPTDGKLTTFDIDLKTSAVAQQFFVEAGLERIIDLVVGNAKKTLKNFVKCRGKNFVDMAFVDADKISYDLYYELCLEALKPGGILLMDNAFRGGQILAPAAKDVSTQTVARLTQKITDDDRVEVVVLPIADGVIMIRKKK